VRVESGAQTPSIGFRRRSPDLLHVKCRVILSLSNAAYYTRSRAKVNSHNQTLARALRWRCLISARHYLRARAPCKIMCVGALNFVCSRSDMQHAEQSALTAAQILALG